MKFIKYMYLKKNCRTKKPSCSGRPTVSSGCQMNKNKSKTITKQSCSTPKGRSYVVSVLNDGAPIERVYAADGKVWSSDTSSNLVKWEDVFSSAIDRPTTASSEKSCTPRTLWLLRLGKNSPQYRQNLIGNEMIKKTPKTQYFSLSLFLSLSLSLSLSLFHRRMLL